VTLRAQFFDAANFTVNTADNCTTYINSTATLANYQNGLPTISVSSPIAPVAMQNGISDIASQLLLSAPGASNTGSVDVTYAAPAWLKYNWDTAAAGDENPLGVASFGYFRGNDRVVYWREVLD
jgi:MSHA biogenesis protein MshQ